MKPRTLKIEASGDYWRGTVTPKIRLAGQWLERAGFKPGCRVEIKINQLGNLTVQVVRDGTASGNESVQTHSASNTTFGEVL